jgi:glycosyltransferase involved in cell wall biosynthesis
VASSKAVLDDYRRLYPNASNPTKVLQFATILPNIDTENTQIVCLKYGIRIPYFIAPNQFWIHKNHQVVLDAALLLKKQEVSFLIVFTGKEADYRYPTYTQDLKKFVIDNDLSDCVYFLGFIPRIDQLVLMKNAIAVLQPSLFEGWSTVVEDTKAINQRIILSDLPVHREQCTQNVTFFPPLDASILSEYLKAYMLDAPPVEKINYYKNIINFAENVINIKGTNF